MDQYNVILNGVTPLLLHADNLGFSEKVKRWQKDPANKEASVAGDDRSPAWIWLGYLYQNKKVVGMPSDNLMTMLREGGAKVKTGRQETFKKQTQSGILIDQEQWTLRVGPNGDEIKVADLNHLLGVSDFDQHLEVVEKLGFELLVKRAKVGTQKHVRVRPMFRTWAVEGTLTVLDAEVYGITKEILKTILNQAGALIGLGDWRPSSPRSSGTFGKFTSEIKLIKG